MRVRSKQAIHTERSSSVTFVSISFVNLFSHQHNMADDSDLTLAYYESISAETKEIERLKKELEDLIEASQTTLNSPAPPPPPIPTTRDNWNQRNFDPESKWVTIKHLELHQMYFIGSWGPLIDYIYHLVKDEFDKLTNPSETTAYRHVIGTQQTSTLMTSKFLLILQMTGNKSRQR